MDGIYKFRLEREVSVGEAIRFIAGYLERDYRTSVENETHLGNTFFPIYDDEKDLYWVNPFCGKFDEVGDLKSDKFDIIRVEGDELGQDDISRIADGLETGLD